MKKLKRAKGHKKAVFAPNGYLDMRFNVNKGYDKYTGEKLSWGLYWWLVVFLSIGSIVWWLKGRR